MKSKFIINSIISFIFMINIGIAKEINLVVPKQIVDKWGYKTTKSYKYMPNFCDPNIKREAQVFYQGIKSKNEVPGLKNTYYRFTLIKEVYPNKLNAVKRLFFVKNLPSKSTKHEKLCYLRKGFKIDSTVFIVFTDSTKFYDEQLDNILEKVKVYQTNHNR